ncbi:hypothetical protein BKA66DRAFT_600735 [Pyrenochaeta sp. MPI-SDFR-AT-0127]|nr:hypothetical protein BKA66DRAFT_600735 [Pyrenochaeta sp. MPI-SDFR-AT-0127]
MGFCCLPFLPLLLLLLGEPCVTVDPMSYNVTGYDTAPDLSKYSFDPYPSLKDESGNQIDAANVRGTRLFGLSHIDGLCSNIAWGDQAAKEMWGYDADLRWPLPDTRKEEIRHDGGPAVNSDYEAYSEERDNSWLGYSKITLCNRFHNNFKTLDEATTYAKTPDRVDAKMHVERMLTTYVDSSPKTPLIDDLLINYGPKSKKKQEVAYGPFHVKVLRYYRGDAWYAGKNADSYAWYAMAIWAKREIGHYPEHPKAGSLKPNRAPRRADGSSLNTPPKADIEDDPEGQEIEYQPAEDFTPSGCGDKMSVAGTTIPTLSVSCVDNASVIPRSVFSSDSNQVYDTFCRGAVNNRNRLYWMSDVFGNLTGNEPTGNSRIKRLAHMILNSKDDGPEQLTNWHFKLDWTPMEESLDGAECFLDCPTAFAALTQHLSARRRERRKI